MPDAMIHSVGLRRRRSASRTEGLRVKIRTDARTVLTLRMAPLCLLPPPLYCGAVWIVWYMAPVTSENKREMGGRKEIIALDPAEDGACADPDRIPVAHRRDRGPLWVTEREGRHSAHKPRVHVGHQPLDPVQSIKVLRVVFTSVVGGSADRIPQSSSCAPVLNDSRRFVTRRRRFNYLNVMQYDRNLADLHPA